MMAKVIQMNEISKRRDTHRWVSELPRPASSGRSRVMKTRVQRTVERNRRSMEKDKMIQERVRRDNENLKCYRSNDGSDCLKMS